MSEEKIAVIGGTGDLGFGLAVRWSLAGAQIVIGSRDDPGPRRAFSPRGMRELVPDARRRDVYMCGPDGLINISRRTLRRLRVPRQQIHLDPFEF